MPKIVKSIVLTGNGTNCEREMAHACRLAGSDEVDIVYQGYLKERKLERILTQNRGLGATISTNSTTTHEQTEDVQ
jgi:phosphoribosylformylglycinamidine (FGAM) synthase-like amidotransferase family enzyme